MPGETVGLKGATKPGSETSFEEAWDEVRSDLLFLLGCRRSHNAFLYRKNLSRLSRQPDILPEDVCAQQRRVESTLHPPKGLAPIPDLLSSIPPSIRILGVHAQALTPSMFFKPRAMIQRLSATRGGRA